MRTFVLVVGLALVWQGTSVLAHGPIRSDDRIQTERVQFKPRSARRTEMCRMKRSIGCPVLR